MLTTERGAKSKHTISVLGGLLWKQRRQERDFMPYSKSEMDHAGDMGVKKGSQLYFLYQLEEDSLNE